MRRISVSLSLEELAAIADALAWNVAKQRWLKQAWRDATARKGHELLQEQAERVLERVQTLMRGK